MESLGDRWISGWSTSWAMWGLVVVVMLWGFAKLGEREGKSRRMNIERVKGGHVGFGMALDLLRVPPWDQMSRWVQEYGNIIQFPLFFKNLVVVAEPELLKQILQTKMTKFRKDVDFSYKPFMDILGTGLVTSEGKLWRAQRTLVSSAFRIDILHEIPPMAKRAVERLISKLERVKGTGSIIDLAEEYRHLTLQVIAEAILSIPPDEASSTFAEMYLPIVTEGNLRVWYPYRHYLPNWSYRHHVRELNEYITSIIEKRWELRQEEKRGRQDDVNRRADILDRIIGAVDEDSWGPSTVKQLRDEIKTFILAGHETSAAMLTWATKELCLDERRRHRLRQEAKEIFGDDNDRLKPAPPLEKCNELDFSLCCLKETLRKYSVVPVLTRNPIEDVQIGDHVLPKDTCVLIGVQALHGRADIWPDPEAWIPERFEKDIEAYTFLPFIEGPRNCIGQHLSLLESKVVLSTIFQRLNFTLVDCKMHPWMIPKIPLEGLLVKVEAA